MPTVYLNIGSNKGDRLALLEQAVAFICKYFPTAKMRRSSIIESEPWGFSSSHRFLNIGVALDFDLMPDAFEMLDALQEIERKVCADAHRNADGSYRDRGIDIDIIAIDDVSINSPRLTLPHPRATKRDFVMKPMIELAPKELISKLLRDSRRER